MMAFTTMWASHGWEVEAVIRLGLAALLGAMIGSEREHHGRSAGLRTQLLVALGSALAMVVSLHFARVYGDAPGQTLRVDPARVAYGVMGGIGFLGAGAIVRYGAGIRGVTTAASLWCTAAVGLACGFGMFAVAIAATVIVLFALIILARVDWLIPTRWYKRLTVVLPDDGVERITQLQQAMREIKAKIVNTDYVRKSDKQTQTVALDLSLPASLTVKDLAEAASKIPGIHRITLN